MERIEIESGNQLAESSSELKYPSIFNCADVAVIAKVDLAAAADVGEDRGINDGIHRFSRSAIR